MSKKAAQSQSSPQAPGGVDFLVRTMIEREATGKRPIRPKNVEDLLQSSMQDESDDPDFDCGDEDSDSGGTGDSDEGSNDSENEGEGNDDSDESDDEDYQGKAEDEGGSSSNEHDSGSDDETSNDESHGSDSDEPDTTKKSALRETLEKLNEANDFIGKRRTKKKRKVIKNKENPKPKKVVAKKPSKKKSTTDSTKPKTSSDKKSSKVSKNSKVSKAKKVVITKKSKPGHRKIVSEKKRRKKREKKSDDKQKHFSILSLVDSAAISQKENRKEIEVTKPICSACLGDKSDDSNEIVECDSCGISVHEICYGLSADNVSISSGSGSSSCTEPWFCDVCKSGSDNIHCELCPIEGGLFKESTAGRWVHLVCAMYTQGVALHHDSSINLYEIHYARWGSHSCAACENERQANTGIVISCDAGLCKTYFHATCAQKLGLLSDPNQVDFAEADPYYVSCKMHTNRETMKRRIRLFNTLQEQLRIKRERKESEGLPSGANADHARILRKLDKVRQKTALKRAQYLNSLDNVPLQTTTGDQLEVNPLCNLPSSWTNGNKKQRLMHTSAKLGNDFLRKTERLGDDIVAHELEVKHEKILANVKRKWNVLPAMSVEYAAYYTDRENRISGLINQYEKSVEENHVLMDKEIGLKDVWETQSVNQMAMTEETESVSQKLESLASIITMICPSDKKLASKLQTLVKPKELSGVRRKSPSTSRSDRKSPTPRRSSIVKKSMKNRILSPSPSRAGKVAVAVCDTCSKSDSQHLITRCDKCRKHYHLHCLDPPLSRMPKRSRLCGWMCSDCCETPSEAEGHVDTEAPRTLRGRTKIHKPRKYRGSDESEDEKSTPEGDNSKAGSKKSPKSKSFSSPESKTPGDLVPPSNASTTIHSSTTMKRRRRSGSTNLSAVTPKKEWIDPGPIPGVTIDGSIISTTSHNSTPTERRRRSGSANSSAVTPWKDPGPIPGVLIDGPISSINHNTTPMERRRRSGSANSSAVSPTKEWKDPSPIPDGSIFNIPHNMGSSMASPSDVNSGLGNTATIQPPSEPKSPKKKKGVASPKIVKAKRTKVNSKELTVTDVTSKVAVVSPAKRKSSDGPLTTFKVNGIHENTLLGPENDKSVSPKAKRAKKRKTEAVVIISDQIKNDVISNNTSSHIQDAKIVKQKKPRKKKERVSISEVSGSSSSSPTKDGIQNEDIVKVEKTKKPRKKKEKANISNSDTSDNAVADKNDRKANKKPVKPRSSLNPSGLAINAAREETNVVHLGMGKVTSQLFDGKTKNPQNGAVKMSKKRKSSQGLPATNSQSSTLSVAAPPDEKEKEKSVPPKKRKRVSSSAQSHGHSNSVDSIIKAVSSGEFSDKTLQNGDCESKPAEMSTLMQGVSPLNRQLAPEQNIMQGKQMSSGFNAGEMVTVDASFLIDGASSGPSSYGGHSSVSTFYPSSNHNNSTGAHQDDSMNLASEGSSTSGNSENVIRLQYIDGPSVTISDSAAMPPPAPVSGSSNGVCTNCTKSDSKNQLVTCDRCQLEFHYMCLEPPKKTSPRKKGQPWFCSACDDGDIQLQENGVLP